eukprot:161544_1
MFPTSKETKLFDAISFSRTLLYAFKRMLLADTPINLLYQAMRNDNLNESMNGKKTIVISPPFHGPGANAANSAILAGETMIFPFPLTSDMKPQLKVSVNILYDAIITHKVNHV